MRELKRWCAALGLAAAATAVQAAAPLLSEGFDDVAMLAASGWALVNQSPEPGTTWFQGNPGIFDAATGAPDSYIASNFLASDAGPISNLLLSPPLRLGGDERISFATRAEFVDGIAFDDNLAVWLGRRVGDQIVFETRLAALGPGVAGGTFPTEWQQVSALVPRQAAPGERFIGFFYISGDAANANYIGLDSVTVSVPEPRTALLLGLGLAGMAVLRRQGPRSPGSST